jgi:hypothetical protein
MPLVSTGIPNLLNGVSQQPSTLRQATQGEIQTNATSSVIDGLVKRPPTEHIAKVINTPLSNAAIHVVNRDEDNQYIIVITATASSASIFAFDIDGNTTTMSTPDGVAYLYCTNPAKHLKFLTVADYTFVVNTTKTVAMTSNTISGSITDSVQEFADLPSNASTNNVYEILGDDSNNFDNYFVKAQSANTYAETVKTGITYQIDATTMPYALVLTGGGFSLNKQSWGDRIVGDLESNPNPSFVGKTISNVFFYKNRLGFLSYDNVIFSKSGEYFDFFRSTVTALLDDAPIDVAISHTKVSILKHAIAFNDSLTLFSENTQFRIENTGNLTPKTISIVPSTEFENDTDVAPVGAGNYLYFATKKGEFSSVREYFVESDTVILDASDVTAHVPKYIPKNLTKMVASSNEDLLVAFSVDDPTNLYVYKWYWSGSDKLISSWSTWSMPTGSSILDISLIENRLYLIISRSDGVFVEVINIGYPNDTGLNINVRADRKVSLTGSYNSSANTTTWTLPYTYSGNVIVAKSGSWTSRKGTDISTTRPSATTVKAVGDYSAQPVLVGVPYEFVYKFSTQHVKENQGNQSVLSGRLQLRTMRVNYENSGYFKVQVTPDFRTTNEYEVTGVVLNQSNSTLEDVIISDGTFRFPVQAKNDRVSIQIVSDSYLPCSFQSAEWEGFYTIHTQRI